MKSKAHIITPGRNPSQYTRQFRRAAETHTTYARKRRKPVILLGEAFRGVRQKE